MKPSQAPPDDLDLEQKLQDLERSLQTFKSRYAQVQTDQQQQQSLQQRLSQIQAAKTPQKTPQPQAEIKQIQQQLEELEISLESQLFSWSSFREVFWQAVRFGGVGVAIGWLLAFAALQSPKPTPQPSLSTPTFQPQTP